ncbi:MlaD family protein [Gordonia sp. HY002]|uniref:MlaD family protein n=1 Tax=Gordonia zhenghanii TaxID=2911516 RepID=UPI001EF07384|nr:MlaD family protein [Gordonia zhenghanii]MCF8571688.1 MlaD family protein [Gordonia zhenghanii]MCF8602711.1 MlaD family protein [Gordonia zhenghanii]
MSTPETGQTSQTRRRHMLVAIALLLVTAVVAGTAAYFVWPRVSENLLTRDVCIDFADSAGLYEGNAVELMGLPVGTVASIEPRKGGVRVTTSVEQTLVLPADAGAVLIDSSIVADRRVEFDRPYTGGPKFTGDECIPVERTTTPRGTSAGFKAVDDLLTEVMGSDSRQPALGGTNDLAQVTETFAKNFGGRGDDIVQLMRDVLTAQGNPNQADAMIRRILDNSDILLREAASKWPDIAETLETINVAGLAFTAFSEEFSATLASAIRWVPVVGRNIARFGDRVLGLIDLFTPWIRVLAPFATHIAQAVAQLPGLATVTDRIFDPETGALRVQWTPPTLPITRSDEAALCAALNERTCTRAVAAETGLVQLILGGAR